MSVDVLLPIVAASQQTRHEYQQEGCRRLVVLAALVPLAQTGWCSYAPSSGRG